MGQDSVQIIYRISLKTRTTSLSPWSVNGPMVAFPIDLFAHCSDSAIDKARH